jgi:transcriptional/translational regulatory protein YebC/TACO1
MIAQTTNKLENQDDMSKMNNLIDMLEEDDDVQNVYTNVED